LGEPDFPTPSYILDATIEAMKNGFTHYSAPQGLPELRELIAQKSTQDYGVEYVADEVIVLPGIKAALFMGLASILEPFDKIVVITPYYVSYPAIIKLAEPTANIINIKLNKDYSLNMDALIDALNKKPKCILVNTPHNPTGTVFKKTEVEEIVKRCAGK
jgi:aspartate aminotransferase